MLPIGTYLSVRLDAFRFGACQVFGHDGDNHLIVGIAYFGPKPTVADLAGTPVLVIDHHHWPAHAQRLAATGAPSAEYEVIGVGEVGAGYAGPVHSSGGWSVLVGDFRKQERWLLVPPEQALQLGASRKRGGHEKLEVKLAGVERSVTRSLDRVTVGMHRQPARLGETAWDVLEGMDSLTRMDCVGPDAGALDFVRRRRTIDDFSWQGHGQGLIDVTETNLTKLTLDVIGGPLEIHVSDRLEELTLVGEPVGRVAVVHRHQGRHLHLVLERRLSSPTAVDGLSELSRLSVSAPRELKLGSFGYPRLVELRMQGDRWLDPEALTQLQELESLRCDNVYHVDAAALPAKRALPKLQRVQWEGVLKDAATTIKAQWKGCQTSVSGGKDAAWVDTTLRNPFHAWVYTDEYLGKDASNAYGGAMRALAKLAADDIKGVEKRLAAFAQSLAKLAAEHDLDAQHRAQARAAFHDLAATVSRTVSDEQVAVWLDGVGFR
jgi:hypothetical protein